MRVSLGEWKPEDRILCQFIKIILISFGDYPPVGGQAKTDTLKIKIKVGVFYYPAVHFSNKENPDKNRAKEWSPKPPGSQLVSVPLLMDLLPRSIYYFF